jgi:hypothetical protein
VGTVLAVLVAGPAAAASIRAVTPQGDVARVQQVVVSFDAPVVALSDGRQPDPVTVQCSGPVPAGSGSWLSPQQWAYDFRGALPPGVACRVEARPGWQPLGGGTLEGRTRFAFQTGGPVVERTLPPAGAQIEEDQHFAVTFTGPVDEASLAGRAGCEVEGLGERIPAVVVGGAARAAVLKAEGLERSPMAARTLLLRCQRPLPQDAPVRLVFAPGLATPANPALVTRDTQRTAFRVRAAFTATFSCERERAQAPCLPIRPLRLVFSEPVARAVAQQLRLVPQAGGTPLAPAFAADDREAEVTEVRFPVPLAENARFRLELPANLRDASGRPLANAGSFPLAVATGEAPPLAKFAAAPFGILESQAEPVLPLTVRHVQGDLRPGASAGQVRVLRLDDPVEVLKAYAEVARLHEQQVRARDAGLPPERWTEVIVEKDERGREQRRRVDRWVGTRELSMLRQQPAARRLDLPALQGGDPRPFEVVGIPLPQPGYHVVEIESGRLGAALLASTPGQPPSPMYVRTGVLVTNLAVHVKLARDGGLVWVTSLDRGRPVADAEVRILDCRGAPLFTGRTDAQGRVLLSAPLPPERRDAAPCLADVGYFVTARKTDARGVADTSFVFSSWHRGIEPWRFGLPLAGRNEPAGWRAHTVFDRTLLRAGETVSMKHFVRAETLRGLALLKPEELPTHARLTHEGSGRETRVALQWSGARSATSRWEIPASAALGRYSVALEREGAPAAQARVLPSGGFRVEAFRVPLVDARLVPPTGAQVAPAELPLNVQLHAMAGGPMAQAALRGSAVWRERLLAFDDYPDFSFQPPADTAAVAAEPTADTAADTAAEDSAAPAGRLVADRVALTTGRDGTARWVIPLATAGTAAAAGAGSAASAAGPAAEALRQRPGELRAEVSYADPNGEIQTVSTRVATWPSAVVVGLRSSGWVRARGDVALTALALDTDGRPLKGQRVEVRARLAQTLSTRKRLVGGFYAYDNRVEREDLGVVCSGSTDAQGRLACTAQLERAGEVELIVQARDAQGRLAQAAGSVWVTPQGELWFAQDNDDRIDVLPEQRRVEPGQTARLQVRMPYREATALVAVEREGLIDTRVVTLRGSDPTVELTVDPAWGPNVYVSVLAVRGRVREVPWYSFFRWGWREPLEWARAFWHEGRVWQPPTAMVDLSRPSAKFGVAALQVGHAAYALKVQVTTDKAAYRIRGTARATVRVSLPDGRPAAGAEVAFAAVDEGLLALQDNDSWDLLHGIVQPRAWGVETATAMSEVIGRRHYGRKAVAAGGGGGRAGARELFDTLLLWNPRVVLDARGEATLEVPLNDALTSHRLVAVADAGAQTFGSGHAVIRVTQDLQVLAGLPPVVRDGDRLTAMVTLRNTTAREMALQATLSGRVSGAAAPDGTLPPPTVLALAPQTVTLPAGSARELSWPVAVPEGARAITWEATAEERGGAARDSVRVVQRVQDAVPLRVLQGTVQQLDGTLTLPVQTPGGALPGRGGVELRVEPTLVASLPGVRRYFETYPYTCLEQLSSRAIGLRDEAAWAQLMQALPGYLDTDGLAAYFPPRAGDAPSGSDRLTAHLVSVAHEAGWALPPAAQTAMLQGLQRFVQGRLERRLGSPRPDLEVRKLAALAALARHGQADARLLGSLRTTPEAIGQWPTAALLDWLTVLQRVADVPERSARREQALQALRARLQYAGSTLRFSQEDADAWWWLMDSPDANAARLIAAVAGEPAWRDEVPRLVIGHLARQQQGAWATTVANVWSVLALERVARVLEATPVSGRTVAALSGGTAVPVAPAARLPWPAGAAAQPLTVRHEGTGRPWLMLQGVAAVPLTEPLRRGYTVTRRVTAVQQKTPGQWSRGDVMRVRLEVEAAADRTWVVVSDPVPAGATVLGAGLGRDSAIATQGERREGSAWPAYEERAADAFRSYFELMPRGRHVVEYTLRLNNPGRLLLPPTRVEAMYAPDSFGETPNTPLEVQP